MRSIRLFPFCSLAVVLFLVVTLAGCGSPSPSDASASAGAPATGPMNEKERLDAERWERATAGLILDAPGGLVEVQPLAAGSVAAAGEHVTDGRRLVGENRVMEALEQFTLAARNDPSNAAAYAGLGMTLGRKGKQDAAIAAFRTAVARDESDPTYRYELAMSLWRASMQREAIDEMNAVVVIDDDHGPGHERLAVWSYYAGDHDTAWRHLHRAEELGNPVPAQLVALLENHAPDPEAAN
jgi:Flp pilus assembly protein TadD